MPQATGSSYRAAQNWFVDQMPRLGRRESRRAEVRNE